MNSEWLEGYGAQLTKEVMDQAPRLAVGLVSLAVGWRIIRLIVRVLSRAAKKRDLDPTLIPFLGTVLAWILRVALLISVASMIGLPMASFLAVLGSAGLAIGLALQGSLSNLAGGVLILMFRPYRVGDLIEAQGVIGIVREIQVFTTTIVNADKKRILVPNGPMFGGVIINYNAEGIRRIDVTIGVSYDTDVAMARAVLLKWMVEHPLVIEDPAPSVEVVALADSSINLAVRPFCRSENYWRVYFDTFEISKRELDRAGITIPFPQRDVHLVSGSARDDSTAQDQA